MTMPTTELPNSNHNLRDSTCARARFFQSRVVFFQQWTDHHTPQNPTPEDDGHDTSAVAPREHFLTVLYGAYVELCPILQKPIFGIFSRNKILAILVLNQNCENFLVCSNS